LKEKGGLFVLSERACLPHVTLYMTEFPSKNVIKIKYLITQLTAKTKSFKIRLSITGLQSTNRKTLAVFDFKQSTPAPKCRGVKL